MFKKSFPGQKDRKVRFLNAALDEEIRNLGITEKDFVLFYPEGAEIPCQRCFIALEQVTEENGTMTVHRDSLLECDKDLSFEKSAANKLLEKFKMDCVVENYGNRISKRWYANVVDDNASIYQPSVYKELNNCCNSEVDCSVEMVMAFDDGFIIPMVKHIKAGGDFGRSFADIVEDLIDTWKETDPDEWLTANFEDCGNVWMTADDEICFCMSNPQTGEMLQWFVERDGLDRVLLDDIQRKLCSIRLIKVDEHLI